MFEPKKYLFEKDGDDIVLYNRIKEIDFFIRSSNTILTSHDVKEFDINLSIQDLPTGYKQTQLPLKIMSGSAMFLTTVEPNAFFPEHVHNNASVFRVIVSGSVYTDDKVLTVGDWMYVPAGASYWIKAGDTGATIVHNYEQEPPNR